MTKSKLHNTLLAATMVAGGMIMGTGPAYATPGIDFLGTDTFLFVPGSANPAVGPNGFVSVTTTELQWANTPGATAYSFLTILPPSNTPVTLTSDSGTWVDVAQIQHENNVIPLPFDFSINLTDKYQLAGATFYATGTDTLGPTILGVTFTETSNSPGSSAACAAASPTSVNPVGSRCDDIFAVPALDSVIGSFLFAALGEDWNLTFRVLADVDAGTFFDDAGNIIYTAEGDTSNLYVQARIDQVPEPGSLALLGLGLLGLPLFARRAAKKTGTKKA